MKYSNLSCKPVWLIKIGLLGGLLLFVTTLSTRLNAQSVLVNEVMASNRSVIADEDGEFSDWIELYNNSTEPVNLEGWGLSDNASNPFKWIFPAVTMQPGSYLMVWASGKDRRPDMNVLLNGIRLDFYNNIPGTNVDNLLNHPSYPNNPTYRRIITDVFEAPSNIGDNYGQRMHGLLKAPATGNYTFWISGDDNSRLFLSTNDQPQNAVKIAEVPGWTNIREWGKYPEQKSNAISLTAGQYYYIMALMKEETGGDNLAVRWQLPDGTVQNPISASHVYVGGLELHTNFSISAEGEIIVLTRPNGNLEHSVPATVMSGNVSYGIKPGQPGFFFFDVPTPGQQNHSSGYNEIITSVPVFSVAGGFYTSGFDLTLSGANNGTSIIYTLDGSEPDMANLGGNTYVYKNAYPSGPFLNRQMVSHTYTSPITINDRSSTAYALAGINTRYSGSPHLPNSNNFKGTVVRAKLVKENALTERSVTNTYFITTQGYNRYSLPVVSIATDEKGLFDYDDGIYVAGKIADTWRAQNSGQEWNDGRPANYNQRGAEWERPGHFEYFVMNEQSRFSQNIGIRIHGGWSRAHYFKSLRLYARTSSGGGTWFEYPFFGDLPSQGNPANKVTSFRRILLRNSGNDFDRTLYRDALMQDLVKHLPIPTQAYQPVIHFINGEYWGIINMRERYDEYYIQSHYGIDPEDVVVLEEGESVDVGLPEDRNHFLETVQYAESNDLRNSTHYEWVKNRVDIENLAHYYAAQIYFYNTDWPQNNYNIWRKRTGTPGAQTPIGHDGRWRWLLFDTDFGMNLYGSNNHTLNGLSRITESSATDRTSRLFRRLLLNQDFRNLFINIVSDQLNTCFQSGFIQSKIDLFNQRISSSRSEHWQRWRSGTDEGGALRTFANQRPAYVRQHMQSGFALTGTSILTVYRQGEGLVRVNSVLIDEGTPGLSSSGSVYPWSGIYFKGVPVTLTAVNTPGYVFSHWEGMDGFDKKLKTIQINMETNAAITAVFREAPILKLIHYWHFNNLETGTLTNVTASNSVTDPGGILTYPGTGAGYMDRVAEGSDINAREQQASLALRVRNPANTRALELSLPTTGFEKVVLKYATNRTNNGADFQNIYYRTTVNGNWILFKENIEISTSFQLVTAEFSDVREADNNPDFQVRITFSGANASGTSGNNRFDNVTLEGFIYSTNVQVIKSEPQVRVVPNPAKDSFSVYADEVIQQVKLLNLEGRLVLNRNLSDFSGLIDISSLFAGVYMVFVQTANGTAVQKLIVK